MSEAPQKVELIAELSVQVVRVDDGPAQVVVRYDKTNLLQVQAMLADARGAIDTKVRAAMEARLGGKPLAEAEPSRVVLAKELPFPARQGVH